MDNLEKEMATHSSTLAWKIPWTKESARLQSMGSWRVGHNWATSPSPCFHALEKEMATHSSILAWRIPGTEEPGGLLSMGSHRVGHDWSDLAVAAAYGQLIYNKGASMYNGEKTPSLVNSAGKSYMQKNQSGLLFHKTHKSSLQMN